MARGPARCTSRRAERDRDLLGPRGVRWPSRLACSAVKARKDVILGRGVAPYPYTQGDDAQIDGLGVVYAVNKWPGTPRTHIVFVPMARVLAAVSKDHVR